MGVIGGVWHFAPSFGWLGKVLILGTWLSCALRVVRLNVCKSIFTLDFSLRVRVLGHLTNRMNRKNRINKIG